MASERPRKILVVFYRTRSGAEVVRDWLRSLDAADRNAIGQDLMRVQHRWPVGIRIGRRPVGSLQQSAQQSDRPSVQRPRGPDHSASRVHQEVPEDDFALARKRKREFEP